MENIENIDYIFTLHDLLCCRDQEINPTDKHIYRRNTCSNNKDSFVLRELMKVRLVCLCAPTGLMPVRFRQRQDEIQRDRAVIT